MKYVFYRGAIEQFVGVPVNFIFFMEIAGYNCHWIFLLAPTLCHRRKRCCFHCLVHSIGINYNSNILSILVDGDPSLGKVCTICNEGCTHNVKRLIFVVPLAKILTIFFFFFGSVCGAILLVGGLYCVLWGKNREVVSDINGQKSEGKDETMLECITQQ